MPVQRWLAELGVEVPPIAGERCCPHLEWAASGAMMLTGEFAPALAPGPVVTVLGEIDGALRALTSRSGTGTGIDPATVLGARAGLTPLSRRGRTSAGGASRLLATRDGWAAVSLVRLEDVDAVPAMFGGDPGADPWSELAAAAAVRGTDEFVARVRLLGVAAGGIPRQTPGRRTPWRTSTIAGPRTGAALQGALVVDLSSLWAGPLCGQILARAGARVVKVESTGRPDGARRGEPRFYDWLHAGQESVALDFGFEDDRESLADLIRSADVVIEASRPRALAQLGVAHHQLDLNPGVVWVSITGHGRDQDDLIAFGDDAAAAGGLVAESAGEPVFCADAIADPLTGVVAALAAVASRSVGGGHLVDVAMSEVAAAFAGAPLGCDGAHQVELRRSSWFVGCSATGRDQRVLGARVPPATGTAPRMGADNDRWLARRPSGSLRAG